MRNKIDNVEHHNKEELVRRWVAALRSGEYKQGVGRLLGTGERDGGKRFCCLGVLCDLVDIGEWDGDEYRANDAFYATELPPEVLDMITDEPSKYGQAINVSFADYSNDLIGGVELDHYDLSAQWNLAMLNDSGASFDKIARIIELELLADAVLGDEDDENNA